MGKPAAGRLVFPNKRGWHAVFYPVWLKPT